MKKTYSLTLSKEAGEKLSQYNNRSKAIEKLIMRDSMTIEEMNLLIVMLKTLIQERTYQTAIKSMEMGMITRLESLIRYDLNGRDE
jgi:hypothetical protein